MNRRYCNVLFVLMAAIMIVVLAQGSAYAEKMCPKCRKHFADKYAFCDKEGAKLSPVKVSATKPQQQSKHTFKPRARNRAGATAVPKIEMIYIPAGGFIMGSQDGVGEDDEHPQHLVYLSAYWIGKYEVTVAQYRAFCKMTGRKMPKAPKWGWKDNHPIVNVTWKDANAFAKWAGGHLPTEAQWEKAARGTDGREYPWGNTWDKNKCNNNSIYGTAPVGSLPSGASPYGCLDMAGNVDEWCRDWYGATTYYDTSPSSDPQGPRTGSYRVMRGEGWPMYVTAANSRCAERGDYESTLSIAFYGGGFRLAR